jgi:aromatic ring-opening dioxygenase LigB subunit
VPLGIGLGARLLDSAGFTGDRLMWTVDSSCSFPGLAASLAAAAEHVGLLVLADGSAHRSLKTSTDLASRAAQFDSRVASSIVDGDLSGLLAVDPALAAELMVTGFPALRLLAAAVPTAASTSLRYSAAPFGVGYFVATLLATPRT